MKIFGTFKNKQVTESSLRLVYASIKSLENAIDSEDEFRQYFFSIYHCMPDEDAAINRLRAELRNQSPGDSTDVGRYFVLYGESAYKALSWYYTAITKTDTLTQEYRDYYAERLIEVSLKHSRSQGLPKPIDLSEGQLADDPKMNFLATLALMNGQIFPSPKNER
jgi:predicted transcriptional regulator